MAINYRIKYKSGDHEIEIESNDKGFVEAKYIELIQDGPKSEQQKSPRQNRKVMQQEQPADVAAEDTQIDINAITNAINDSDKQNSIEEKILNKSNRLNRILLILYFTNEIHGPVPISTGEIEKITDQLGIKISSPNVPSAIKKGLKFFAADGVRKRGGATVRYKINKKGIDEVRKLITV